MSLPRIFVTRRISSIALQKLQHETDVDVWPEDGPPPHDVLVQKIAQDDGILTLLTDPIDREVIMAASDKLKIISQMAVGTDNIDVACATERSIPVGHTPDALTEACADFTWALMTALSRRVVESATEVSNGIWRPWGPDVLLGPDLYGATLGIIGLGRIGMAVARRAAGFNMRVLYFSQHRKPDAETKFGLMYCELEDLLRQSDFVSLHTSLNEHTHHLINKNNLAMMRSNAYLINIARGKVVDSEALTQALLNHKIAGAALDVFDPEPIPEDHPLLQLKNVILTPHIASASIQARTKIANMAVENILAALHHQPIPYCFNPQVYKK